MDCDWEYVPGTLDSNGRMVIRCRRPGCRIVIRSKRPLDKIHSNCEGVLEAEQKRGGPGTELTKLLKQLGAKPDSSCNCAAKAAEWDRNGIEWCKSHRAEMVAHLKDAYSSLSWSDIAAFTARAVASGLAFKIGFGDAAEWLVTEALRRAEAQAAAEPTSQDGRTVQQDQT